MVSHKIVQDAIKNVDKEIEDVIIVPFLQNVTKQRVNKKGFLVVEHTFSSEQFLKDPNSIPLSTKHYKLVPFLLCIKFKDKEEEK